MRRNKEEEEEEEAHPSELMRRVSVSHRAGEWREKQHAKHTTRQ